MIKRLLVLLVSFILFAASPAIAMAATLSLSPASGSFNKGCPFSLEIKLDTGGVQTDGTDAYLLYDASKFTATNIASGTIYAEYPGNGIDDNAGKVSVSGLAAYSSPFTGTGTLATINFTVKDSAGVGAAMIRFDFDANDRAKTSDSNVVKKGDVNDVLSSVTNGNYTIGTGACGAAAPAPTVPPVVVPPGTGGPGSVYATPSAEIPYKEVPYKTLPPAGSEQLTYTIAIVGSVLTVLGILGLALL